MSWIKALLLAAVVALVASDLFALPLPIVWGIVTHNGPTGAGVGLVSAVAVLLAALLVTRRSGTAALRPGLAFGVVLAPVAAAAVAAWSHGRVVAAGLAGRLPTTSDRLLAAMAAGFDRTLALVGTAMLAGAAAAIVLGASSLLRAGATGEETPEIRQWRLRLGAGLFTVGVVAGSAVSWTSQFAHRIALGHHTLDPYGVPDLLGSAASALAGPGTIALLAVAVLLVGVRRPRPGFPAGALLVGLMLACFVATAAGVAFLGVEGRRLLASPEVTASSSGALGVR